MWIKSTSILSLKKYLGFYLLIFILYIFFLPKTGFEPDIFFWKYWCAFIFRKGLYNIYNTRTDYLPMYHYILMIFGFLMGSVKNIYKNIYYLKIITLIFDFISGFFLIKLLIEKLKNSGKIFLKSLFYFLNIFVFYNSVIWGQIDGIIACFVFISFYYAYKKRILLSLVFFIIALNFKLQVIIFSPFIGLMILPEMINQFNLKRIIQWIIIPLIVQILIILPFIFSGTLNNLWNVVLNSFGKFPLVSPNAYNIWSFVIHGNPAEVLDSQIVFGLSYKNWGSFLFFIASFVALFPLIKFAFKSIKTKISSQFPIEKLLIIGSLIPLLFFYLNTEMHERYSHPAFIFLITYCIIKKKPLLGIIASVAYFLNLEDILHFLRLHNYGTLIFSRKFIASLYFITIILLFNDLYEIVVLRKIINKFTKFKDKPTVI